MNDGPRRDEDKKAGGFPVFNRLVRAGSSGLEATTIGWTLSLCIVLGALAGIALDKRLGTGYWTPILFLAGVAAGFMQMIRTLNAANRAEEARRQQERQSRSNAAPVESPRATPAPGESAEPLTTPVRASRVPPPFETSEGSAPKVELPSDIDENLAKLRRMLDEERTEDDKK